VIVVEHGNVLAGVMKATLLGLSLNVQNANNRNKFATVTTNLSIFHLAVEKVLIGSDFQFLIFVGIKQINLEMVAASFWANLTYKKYQKFHIAQGFEPLAKSTFYSLSHHVWREAEQVAMDSFDGVAKYLSQDKTRKLESSQ
jgi:hypothetical protein